MSDLETIEAIARSAVVTGGAELRRRYRVDDDEGTYTAHDVKAAADVAAEERMLPIVRAAFPDHPVFAEEAGEFDGSGPFRWIVDPLDGTNNFAAGLPTFASAVSVLHEGEPAVAAVYLPVTDERYLARRGAGVRYGGVRVFAESDVSVEAATVALIFGRDVPRQPELAREAAAIADATNGLVKRVCHSWAPTVHSGLFARGRIQALVQFHPDEEERAVTELFAAEAGAAIRQRGPLFVAATDEATLEVLWTAITNQELELFEE